MKTEIKVSDRCIQNLEKAEKDRQYFKQIKINKIMTIENCFAQNQRMILKYKEA